MLELINAGIAETTAQLGILGPAAYALLAASEAAALAAVAWLLVDHSVGVSR